MRYPTRVMGILRIVLGDDHAMIRAGLRMLISTNEHFEVVGEAETCSQLLEVVKEQTPDAVVMEVSLGGESTFPVMMQIGTEHPSCRILVLTSRDEETFWKSAVAIGASGYLVKRAHESELIAAVRAICQGRSFISVSDSRGQSGLNLDLDVQSRNLSPRETEVLTLLAEGHTYEDVANRLHISSKTVGTYRTRLAEKLGLQTRAEIVRYALEVGLLS